MRSLDQMGLRIDALDWQAGEADAGGVDFIARVEANQQSSEGLDDAGVFEFSAVQGANARDFCGEFARCALRFIVVAANKDIAIYRAVFCKQLSAEIVKRGGDRDGGGNQFAGLLGG